MLHLSHLSKTYAGGVHALSDINLAIPTGLFGLLGPNGAGKSTLMRTIATLQSPDTGELRFGDIDVLRDKMALRRLPASIGHPPCVNKPNRQLDTHPVSISRAIILVAPEIQQWKI